MTDVNQRFGFDLPDGWEDGTTYFFFGPQVDDEQHLLQMTINRHLQTDDIEEFAGDYIDPVVDSLEGIEILKDEEVSPGDYPVWEFVYKWVPAEGLTRIQKYVFVIVGDRGYSFGIQFSKRTYKTVGQQLPEVIESLLPGSYRESD